MIPFNRPPVLGSELDYVRQALEHRHLSGDGDFTKRCHALLQDRLGVAKALLTHSCTGALEMAAILCDLKSGDEVIMPSYTFVSTANAVVLRGAIPVFVDVTPDTINIDPEKIEAAITPRTRAIFAVHYAGVPAEMDAINAIAEKHGLLVVEDAAQALGSTYRGRPAGALGHMAAFSFHETKNIVSGEGGALVLNDPRLVERAEIIREKGTNRSQFFRGEVDKYTWVDIGSSYLPSEIIAAFLLAQLERLDQINANRLATWRLFHDAFADLEAKGRVRRPKIPSHVSHNGHLFYLLLRDLDDRQAFLAALREAGVYAVFHYVPLHSAPGGRKFGRTSGDLPVTTDVADQLVRLPLYYDMGGDGARVLESALACLEKR